MKALVRWMLEYEFYGGIISGVAPWFLTTILLGFVLGPPLILIFLGYSLWGITGALLGAIAYFVGGIKLFQIGNQLARRHGDKDWQLYPGELEFKKDFWRFVVAGWLHLVNITVILAKNYAYTNNHAEAK